MHSTLQALQIISNYRSFVSLLAAYHTQNSVETEQQFKSLYAEILSEQSQFLTTVHKIVSEVRENSVVMNNIKEELAALT